MPPLLDPSMNLRRDGERITLRRRTWYGRYPHFEVHPLCAVILALLDGERSEEEVTGIIAQVFDFAPDTAAKTTRLTLRKYRRFLIDRERLDGRPAVAYDPTEFVVSAPPPPRLWPRHPVPQYISWRVTRYCNRRCKYCCVAARHAEQAPDALFPFERAREIFTEGADIGVRGVSLTGGEPFIRRDMVDLVELLLRLEYEVDIDTKFALSDAQIGQLAAAGLPLIHVSLDSPSAAMANDLVGDATFFEDITRSIRSLVVHGVRVSVNAVLTERNVRELPELAELVTDLGVEQIKLNTFSRYYGQGRYVAAFELSDESMAWLRDTLPALQETYAGRLQFTYDRNFDREAICTSDRSQASAAPISLNCDQGIRVLRLLPDGRVSRCDQWRVENDVVFGDLRTQSLYDVWTSPALLALLNPPRERFRSTACGSCEVFDACSATGRCIFASQELFGTPYAPDNHCVRRSSV